MAFGARMSNPRTRFPVVHSCFLWQVVGGRFFSCFFLKMAGKTLLSMSAVLSAKSPPPQRFMHWRLVAPLGGDRDSRKRAWKWEVGQGVWLRRGCRPFPSLSVLLLATVRGAALLHWSNMMWPLAMGSKQWSHGLWAGAPEPPLGLVFPGTMSQRGTAVITGTPYSEICSVGGRLGSTLYTIS